MVYREVHMAEIKEILLRAAKGQNYFLKNV